MSRALAQHFAGRAQEHGRGFAAGVVIGVVTNNSGDPDGLSRVKVKFPGLSDLNESFWARVVTPMAGPGRGLYFLPEVDDEVLVMFADGDVRFPYVIGALWNGQDQPPTDNSDGDNNLRMIKSRSGHVITLNDEAGSETVEIIDKTGNNSVVIDTATNSISIRADGDISLSAPNGTVTIAANAIKLTASTDATIASGAAGMTVRTDGNLTVQGEIVNIN